MKVIYDEARAMESTNWFQNADRKHTAAGIVCVILAVLGLLGFGLATAALEETGQEWCGYAAGGSLIVAVGVVIWYCSAAQPARTPEVICYTAAQGKKVLGAEIKQHDCCGYTRDWVHLIFETADGDVEHTPICAAKYQENTTVSEAVFDVNAGVIYTPYKYEEREG